MSVTRAARSLLPAHLYNKQNITVNQSLVMGVRIRLLFKRKTIRFFFLKRNELRQTEKASRNKQCAEIMPDFI